ncbi:MAG TPA: hypothetical protein VHR15_09580, partial [Ktedonobacterales bacterium]|nr:hypothetical protein [Ktedonobacterales bacterium]
ARPTIPLIQALHSIRNSRERRNIRHNIRPTRASRLATRRSRERHSLLRTIRHSSHLQVGKAGTTNKAPWPSLALPRYAFPMPSVAESLARESEDSLCLP